MTDTTPLVPGPPSGPPAHDVRPTALQAVVTLVGGLVLAAGSCAGFLGTLNLNRESAVNAAFAIGFFASVIAAGVGLVLVIVRQVKLMNRRRASALQAAGASPGTAGTAVPADQASSTAMRSRAWKAVLLGAALLAAAIVFVLLLVATDPNPIAIVFLLLAAASGLGSIVALLVGVIRYGQGR